MDVRTPIPTNYGHFIEKFGETWKTQVSELKAQFASQIEEVRMPLEYPTDMPIVYVRKEALIQVLDFLKSAPGFDYNFLTDITATDEEADPRFEVVYHLFSTQKFWRIRIKTRVSEGQEVPTAVNLWPGANWQEREVWDMFGIKFSGHPDLRRILMDDRWVGHPLRKDYPLRGYQTFTTPMPANESLLDDGGSR